MILIELTEHAIIGAIIGAVVGMVAAVTVAASNHRDNKKQLEQQKKTESAKLAFQWSKKWEDTKEFAHIIARLEKPDADFANDKRAVDYVLGVFEDIAVLRKDETLIETHVREFFGRDIVRIAANKSIMKIVDEYHQEDVEHNYNNLKKMLDDSKKWGMNPYSPADSSTTSP